MRTQRWLLALPALCPCICLAGPPKLAPDTNQQVSADSAVTITLWWNERAGVSDFTDSAVLDLPRDGRYISVDGSNFFLVDADNIDPTGFALRQEEPLAMRLDELRIAVANAAAVRFERAAEITLHNDPQLLPGGENGVFVLSIAPRQISVGTDPVAPAGDSRVHRGRGGAAGADGTPGDGGGPRSPRASCHKSPVSACTGTCPQCFTIFGIHFSSTCIKLSFSVIFGTAETCACIGFPDLSCP